MTTSRIFRSRDQWQSIIDDFSSSGLSAPKFCEQNNLPYGSFAKWRLKLLPTKKSSARKPSDHSFLDLSLLPSVQEKDAQWHITLKLGNGVELVLSQA